MIKLKAPYRWAQVSDAPILAKLVNYAGHGMPEYIWAGMAGPGQDPWEIGETRVSAKAEKGEIIVIDEGSGAVAGLTGYVIPEKVDPVPDDMPPLFRPLQELENMAPSSWYINVLATLPECRGKGYGSKLLSLAEKIAESENLKKLSLIVANDNVNAIRLYERTGYHEAASRPVVTDDWQTDTSEWVLMIKQLD